MDNVKKLSALFNEYVDEEAEAFKKFNERISGNGIILHFSLPQFGLFTGLGSLLDILEKSQIVLRSFSNRSFLRDDLFSPFLFNDNRYEISILDSNKQALITENLTLKDLASSPHQYFSVTPQFLASLPANTLSIKFKLLEIGDTQTQYAQHEHLFSPTEYAESLIKNIHKQIFYNGPRKLDFIEQRLPLFGYQGYSREDVKSLLNKTEIIPSGFGITNCFHLQYVSQNIHYPRISNEELLVLPEEWVEKEKKVKTFLNILKSENPQFAIKIKN